MKIAAKKSIAALAIFAGIALCLKTEVLAQVSGGAVDAVAASAQRVSEAKTADPVNVEPHAPVALPKEGNETDVGTIPESVRAVVKKLDGSTKNVTLDDLNAARETIAKLDILLDIEKRLNDLSKLRQDRAAEESMAPQGIGLPASAVTAPPSMTSMAQMQQPQPISMTMSSDSVEISRIIGANGHYSAYLAQGDNKDKGYHEGDTLPDGSVIKAISGRGVTVLKNKKTQVLKVKDVPVVFNGK